MVRPRLFWLAEVMTWREGEARVCGELGWVAGRSTELRGACYPLCAQGAQVALTCRGHASISAFLPWVLGGILCASLLFVPVTPTAPRHHGPHHPCLGP